MSNGAEPAPSGSRPKLALYMSGSSAEVLRLVPDYVGDIECSAICPNWNSYEESKSQALFPRVDYLYDDFNERFVSVSPEAVLREYGAVNFFQVLAADKSLLKRQLGHQQVRFVAAMASRIERALLNSGATHLFFPIIETAEAMLAYRVAELLGVRTLVNSTARIADLSFISSDFRETLPEWARISDFDESLRVRARTFLDAYQDDLIDLMWTPEAAASGSLHRDPLAGRVVERLARNLWLSRGLERHNPGMSFSLSVQVNLKKVLEPLRGLRYKLLEPTYLRPEPLPDEYDYFPLHFSPESSINTPAPFYVDQLRVIDRIMLERPDPSRPLVVKEHPSMYGTRTFAFYKQVKHRPLVQFVSRDYPQKQLLRGASTVYSVTGTSCLEKFLLGGQWVQFGTNMLSDWVERRKNAGLDLDQVDFLCTMMNVGAPFKLYSPGISSARDAVLFSEANIQTMCAEIVKAVRMSASAKP